MIRKYIFDYDTEILESGQKKRFPVIVLHIQARNKKWYQFKPYLDTGADISLLTRLDAELLGLDIYKGQEELIGGVGGGLVKTYTHSVQVQIGETKLRVPVAFADSDETPRLLGRRNIFSKFYIGFNESKHRCVLIEKNQAAVKLFGEIF